MKALVTGGAGFLGSHIVDRLLAAGHRVRVLDHRLHGKCLSSETLRKVEAIESDITHAAAVSASVNGCDAIFHCAAMVGMEAYTQQPARTMEVEEAGLRNICAGAVAHGVGRIVFASSSAVYGRAGGAEALREDLEVAPLSNYGVAKRFNELYLAAQFSEHGLRSAALRIFNIYGPRQDERLVIPRFVRQARAGEPLNIYGDGLQTRDFVYAGDVAALAVVCAERIQGAQIVNACSGQETSVRTLAERIVALSGSRSRIDFHPAPAARGAFEVARSFGSRDRMTEITCDHSPTPLDEGLRSVIASFALDKKA
jgi:UDP-glucose 4-epimerase